MSPAIEFERIADTALYETVIDGSVGWAAYVLSSADLPDTIGLEESLTGYNGNYLFAHQRPPQLTTDPTAFSKDALSYLLEYAGSTQNRIVAWLDGDAFAPVAQFGGFGFQFSSNPPYGGYKLRSGVNCQLGRNAQFFAYTNLSFEAQDAAGGLVLSLKNVSQPFIGYQNGGSDLGISVQNEGDYQRAYIPVSGPNTGCFVFSASIRTAVTLAPSTQPSGLDGAFIYSFLKQQKAFTLRYPAFDIKALPATLNCVGTIDPSDPDNSRADPQVLRAGYVRTGFGISGAPLLASGFRSTEGNSVSLVPAGISGVTPSLPPRAGGFAFARCPGKDGSGGKVYLSPCGRFGAAFGAVGPGVDQRLMCGLFGSERITLRSYDKDAAENDLLSFVPSQAAYAPIFPFETATLDSPESGAVADRLDSKYTTSWATVVNGRGITHYSAQPEGSPLYGIESSASDASVGVAVLPSAPPQMPLPQGAEHSFPLVPYSTVPPVDKEAGTQLTTFESQILAPERKILISSGAVETWAKRATSGLVADGPVQYSTTPQGFVVQTNPEHGAYLDVQLAQSIPPGKTAQEGFSLQSPTRAVQDALQTNQLFLVAVNPEPFTSSNATFANCLYAQDWTIKTEVGHGCSATSYRNVMIFKFCDGNVRDRVTNPNRWTAPSTFSSLTGGAQSSVEYTGLSQWLQDYIDAGIALANGGSSFYQSFKALVEDPNWNGVLVLEVDLSAENLPAEIRGIAAGIDFTQFVAHHFGFSVSRVIVDRSGAQPKISMDGTSSIFGLIDYQHPSYAANLSQGVDPEIPIKTPSTADYDFLVLQLQSRFENARLVQFQSRIQLTVNRLLESRVGGAHADGTLMPANAVVLDGSFVRQGGDQAADPAYVFVTPRETAFTLDSNVVQAVAFNRVQFNTLGTVDNGATVASRFLVWGQMDFVPLHTTAGDIFDIWSFGSPAGTEASRLGVGLAFSNLTIQMSFPSTTPNAKTFAADTENLAYDLGSSHAREESLFRGFGLQLKSFLSAAGDKTPADYGFLPVTSQLNLEEMVKPWFGVVYQVTLGGPGALASAVGFTSNLMLAWSPATLAKDAQKAIFIGLSLPGAAPGAQLFSVQGVFKVSVGSIALLRQQVPGNPEGTHFYCLRLDDIALKIFGIAKLPPGATIRMFIFGEADGIGSMAWYAAYISDPESTAEGQQLSEPVIDQGLPGRSTTRLKAAKSMPESLAGKQR